MSPRPAREETLSSWIERTGLFYGCEYEYWLGPVMVAIGITTAPTNLDVDASREIRRLFHQWTGIALNELPLAAPVSKSDRLPMRARITYCWQCWDDDVAEGGQPYIREVWGRWCSIHCAKHGVFLSTRTSELDPFHAELQWMPVWQSERRWLASFGIQREMRRIGEGQRYSPGKSRLWSPAQWKRLSEMLERLAASNGSVAARHATKPKSSGEKALALAKSPEFRPICTRVTEFATTAGKGKSLRMAEADFRGRFEPLPDPPASLETRIGMMVVAAEIACMLEGSSPIHEKVACLLKTSMAKSDQTHVLSRLTES